MNRYVLAVLLGAALYFAQSPAADVPPGYWSPAETDAILDKTLRIHLAPSLEHLSAEENAALGHLLAAGQRLHSLYLLQKHHQALTARAAIARLDVAESAGIRDLYRLAKGPVVTTLANKRVPFVPVAAELPGRNVYPLDLGDSELRDYLQGHADQRDDLLAERTVVRRANAANAARYLAVLETYPVLDTLHPGLRARLALSGRSENSDGFLAIPYSVEYAEDILAVYGDLTAAADGLAAVDADFAAYLHNRARDLLSDDYESGDASWVAGRFGNLNAQIGSYETYDDKLFGAKSFFSMSLLARDADKSRQLAGAIAIIQDIEDALPYDRGKRVRTDIPVGVYNVIADFGQARGGNTATILPNDVNHARKYGRTIMLRYDIMTHPDSFANTQRRFAAATAPAAHEHLTSESRFVRTLFHEIGHYLGVDKTRDGQTLDLALGKYADLLEEMKSDLVSLFAVPQLVKSGQYTAEQARSIYAAGISRTLQVVEPRRRQPYQTMQLMQFNYFLERRVLAVDETGGVLTIDYERYPRVVEDLLREVLALQSEGDEDEVAAFVERWGYWRDEPHARLAGRMRDSIKYRYTLVTYAAEDRATR